MLPSRLVLAISTAALLGACATGPSQVSVADTIARDPQLSTLNGLIQKAGLADTLKGSGPYTVFAPTNDAFKAVSAKTMTELSTNPTRLKEVLSYHVLPARLPLSSVKMSKARTVQGGDLALAKAGTIVTVEEAMVESTDIAASNGLVHTVDRVLMPPVRR